MSVDEYNKIIDAELKKDLRNLGYGFIEQKGYYGTCNPEISFFVPFNGNDDKVDSKAFKDAIYLMEKNSQKCILIYDKYSDGSGIYYLYQNGGIECAGEFHKIYYVEEYMPILKGKEKGYTFESVGIRSMIGHASLSPYYQYLREGHIPISADFKKLKRRRFENINKEIQTAKKEWVKTKKNNWKEPRKWKKKTEFIDLKAIMGAPSDNIKGLKGIGKVIVNDLIIKYKSIENIEKHLDEINKAVVKKGFTEQKDEALFYKNLVTIRKDVPIDVKFEDLEIKNLFNDKTIDLIEKLESKSQHKRFNKKQNTKKVLILNWKIHLKKKMMMKARIFIMIL